MKQCSDLTEFEKNNFSRHLIVSVNLRLRHNLEKPLKASFNSTVAGSYVDVPYSY
jgi:hypothetical protein